MSKYFLESTRLLSKAKEIRKNMCKRAYKSDIVAVKFCNSNLPYGSKDYTFMNTSKNLISNMSFLREYLNRGLGVA